MGRRIRTDANGFLLTTDGQAIDPNTIQPDDTYIWQYEPVVMDFKAEILDVLRKTMRGKFDRNARQDPPDFLKVRLGAFGNKQALPLPVRQLLGQAV